MQPTTGSDYSGSTGGTGSSPSISSAAQEGAARIERLGDSAHDTVNRVADATASTVRNLGVKGEEMRRHWMETQDYWVGSARECVRTHPIASVAVAVGIGMLLSRLTSR